MKNIFLKETDQESELYYNTHANVYGHSKNVLSMGGWVVNQFIYITNNEEIKEGVYGIVNGQVGKIIITHDGYEFQISKNVSHLYGDFYSLKDVCKKIVLTNDPSLIEDGVQQVNSSFLSFYAENPIDYVEVIKELNETDYNIYVDYTYSYSLNFPPKENREQSSKTEENIIDQWLEKNDNPEISKQVEKEAELYQTINKIIDGGKNLPKGFEVSRGQAIDYAFDVALEVAEKLYTEEDLHNAFYNGWIYRGENYTFPKAKKEWLEQFKNR